MEEAIISVDRLTKRFGNIAAVEDLTFDVARGKVTGFLGPNGAGKTTTIRMILGLIEPTSGSAMIGGRPYVDLPSPARVVGALIDGARPHPSRAARDHLRILAAQAGVDSARVEESLAIVGLETAADRRVDQFSLGMRQRLSLAAALLADPELLILDEPANGLDPAGIRWLRTFLKDLSVQDRSVFVSSHQLSEIAQLADEVVVLNRGRLVTQGPVRALTTESGTSVRTPDAERLDRALKDAGAAVTVDGDHLVVEGMTPRAVGEMAAREGVTLHELTAISGSLEDVFLSLTADEGGQ